MKLIINKPKGLYWNKFKKLFEESEFAMNQNIIRVKIDFNDITSAINQINPDIYELEGEYLFMEKYFIPIVLKHNDVYFEDDDKIICEKEE